MLSPCVLAVVADDETYGYAIAQRLQAAGLGTVKGGTLYPVLTRLEAEGLVASSRREGDAGPGRKFFTVTPAGRAHLEERSREWAVFVTRAAGVISSEPLHRKAPA